MITESQVLSAQDEWANAVIKIGQVFKDGGENLENVADELISKLYAYGISTVLFKPTLAAQDQFRGTKEQALSYFIAKNGVCSEDHGFAIKPWEKVRFDNTGIILGENNAQAMGNYFFTDYEGNEIKVEYTFGYLLDDNGNLRINLHHSSIPYQA
jgi:hypothetical protein